MRGHQKYFAVEKRGGELAAHFLAVINLARDAKGLVRAGHERVLKARFADAQFFWESDQKCRLADYLPKLERVTYESRLGSYRDKVERVPPGSRAGFASSGTTSAFRRRTCPTPTAPRSSPSAIWPPKWCANSPSCKVWSAVFTPRRKESLTRFLTPCMTTTARSVSTIRSPATSSGAPYPLPTNSTPIVGCFAVGVVPTGSSDPFALRRAGLGIVKIILEKKLPLSLADAIAAAAKALHSLPPKRQVTAEQEKQVLEFLLERAKFVFREKEGLSYDEVNAVFRAGADDLVDARKRLDALRAIRKSKNFDPLTVSFKRIRKILEKAAIPSGDSQQVEPNLFEAEAERALYASMLAAIPRVNHQKRAGHYKESLEVIAALRPDVDRFFEQVMVMAEDAKVPQ
jgi:glycyl-tRNA synthetase beta chain